MRVISSREHFERLNVLYPHYKSKAIHWVFLCSCIALYFVLNYQAMRLSLSDVGTGTKVLGEAINKSTLIGIIAQGQIITIVLLTVNPIKNSRWIGVLLCSLTLFVTICFTAVFNRSEALPGAILSITCLGVIFLIAHYNERLNKQIKKVVEYSRIVQKNEELLHNLAYCDDLTGIPNRKMMLNQINLLSENSSENGRGFILVYLDLDNFKKINDSMGHDVGDEILKQVTQRWKSCCHKEDILGRIGGDEFVVLIRRSIPGNSLLMYLDEFRNILSEAVVVQRKEFFIRASFGITKFPEDGVTAEELFRNADIALSKAKNSGKNEFQFYTKEMQEELVKRVRLENGLMTSIRNNELYMVFQPQYVRGSTQLRGYEALVRWKHPEMGLISPSEFIPVAEETGLIIEIGEWILETVLNTFGEMNRKYHRASIISVNISVMQIIEPSFVSMIEKVLQKTGFNCNYLELEITESVFMNYPEYVIDVIYRLKELGIRIALDDFGTGYASLNYLQILPINVLKIDKTFIDKIVTPNSINQIVGPIITLSHQLGIEVVAEGVEKEEQLKYLTEHGCDYIQGFLMSKPIEVNYLMKELCFD